MPQYPRAEYHLDNDEAKIRSLQFTCDPHSDKSRWISPAQHKGTLVMHTANHPLVVNYIADDRKSILVRLDDQLLHSILSEVETKVLAASPNPQATQPLIQHDESGKYPDSLKLKCAFTNWVDANTGEPMEEALASRNISLTSWCINVYRLNEFRGRWYFGVNLLAAKVSRAEPTANTNNGGREDFTRFL
jgi:hypothetical protein